MVHSRFCFLGDNDHSLSSILYRYRFYFLHPPLLSFDRVTPGDYWLTLYSL